MSQLFPMLPLVLEGIDTVEKAVAIYQVAPSQADMKTILLEGITKVGHTFRPKVPKEDIEEALAKL